MLMCMECVVHVDVHGVCCVVGGIAFYGEGCGVSSVEYRVHLVSV